MKSPAEKCLEVIDWLVVNRGARRYQIEEKCGIAHGSISNWTRDGVPVSNLSAKIVSRLLIGYPQINADWMMRDDEQFDMFNIAKNADGVDFLEENAKLKADNERLTDENKRLKQALDAANAYIQALKSVEDISK